MQSTDRDDLDWLAFRYVAGELSPAETDSFEQRLADDQVAREAVARAVDLAQVVASVPTDVIPLPTTHDSPLTTHTARPRHRLRAARWIAAAAALVLGVVGIQFFHGSSEKSRLAKAWFKMHLGQDAGDNAGAELIADSDDPLLDEPDLTVPGWMIEAVGGGSDSDKWEDS